MHRILLLALLPLLFGCASAPREPMCSKYRGTSQEEQCLKWRKRDLNIPEMLIPRMPNEFPRTLPDFYPDGNA